MNRNVTFVVILNQGRLSEDNRTRLRGGAGMTTSSEFTSDVIINLQKVWNASRRNHRPFQEELVRTVEHEYAHAIGADDEEQWCKAIDNWMEMESERISWGFEDAGAWARDD